MAKQKTDFYKAKEGFAAMQDGELVHVAAGEIVRAGNPIMKHRESLFAPVDDFGRFDRPDVEQATAAPGEKRGEPKASAPAKDAKAAKK
jgi:hypothetical protein